MHGSGLEVAMFVIAGATGHVGSVVASELLAAKQPVKVIVRDPKQASAWSECGAEIAVGSLEDRAFLTTALKGAKGFFVLLPPNLRVKDFYAYQTKLADSIAGAVKASGVPHVVMLSSIGADVDKGTGPIRGLHYLEEALRGTGTKLTALRACSFQENVAMMLAPATKEGIFPCFLPASQPIPWIASRDVGVLAAKALLAPPAKSEIEDLVGPSYSEKQLAAELGKKLGRELRVVELPRDRWESALEQAGVSADLAPVMAEMYDAFSKGLLRPKGDRMLSGTTTIDATLASLVRS
jgi:uncharacterized protein YbjT (DUF2867 family)